MNIIKNNQAFSNASYREYLTNNADTLIKGNQEVFCNYKKFLPKTNNNKYLFKSINDTNKPFGYESSDLKIDFLKKQFVKRNSTAPIISKEFLNSLK